MIKGWNKRGSHVGMIISFAVFIVFLVFLYTVLEPTIKVTNEKEIYFEGLEKQLIEAFSSELISIFVSSGVEGDCVSVNLGELEFGDLELGNEGGFFIGDVNYNFVGGNLNVDSTGDFTAYYSREFIDESASLGGDCVVVDVGVIRKNNYIFKSKVENLGNLDIDKTGINNFSFELLNNTKGNVVGGIVDDEISTEVVVKDVSVEYVDSEANINVGYLRIKIW